MPYNLDPANAAFTTGLANQPGPHQMGNYAEAGHSLEDLQRHNQAEDIVTERIVVQCKYGPTEVVTTKPKGIQNSTLPVNFYTPGEE